LLRTLLSEFVVCPRWLLAGTQVSLMFPPPKSALVENSYAFESEPMV